MFATAVTEISSTSDPRVIWSRPKSRVSLLARLIACCVYVLKPCALTVSEPSVEIKSNGGSATVTIKLENYAGKGAPRVNPSTDNWADIIILAEPHAPTDGDAMRFTISSVSGKAGAFTVTFSSPCGKQNVTVNVK